MNITKRSKTPLVGIVLVLLVIIIGGVVIARSVAEKRALEQLEGEYNTRASMEEEQKALEIRNPLITRVPYYQESFEVHYGMRDRTAMKIFYPIVLKPSLKPSNGVSYQSELESIKQQALGWIEKQGFDPRKLDIEWRVE